MIVTLLITAFFMGLAGGPHCIVMCGAACQAMQASHNNPSPITLPQNGVSKTHSRSTVLNIPWSFYLGRFFGYALLGSVAAQSMRGLVWLADHSLVMQPVWTFFHALVFAWGLLLIIFGQQPMLAVRMAQRVWGWIQQYTYHARLGYLVTGMLWALLPCGLLYSAVMLASLQSQWLQGALVMLSFAFGSALILMLGPWCIAYAKLNPKLNPLLGETWGLRISGLVLLVLSAVALWMDVMHHDKLWCNSL